MGQIHISDSDILDRIKVGNFRAFFLKDPGTNNKETLLWFDIPKGKAIRRSDGAVIEAQATVWKWANDKGYWIPLLTKPLPVIREYYYRRYEAGFRPLGNLKTYIAGQDDRAFTFNEQTGEITHRPA